MNGAPIRRGHVRRTLVPIAVAILVLSAGTEAQSPTPAVGSPAWVVDQFFVQKSFPDKARHLAGEMAEHYPTAPTLGAGLPADARATWRVVQADSAKAVYSVYIRTPTQWADWYAYLDRIDGVWKLSAVRTLALPAFFYNLMDSLAALQSLPDSLRGMLPHMRLTTASDSALRVFFTANAQAMDRIATEFGRTSVPSVAASPAGRNAPTAELRALPAQLATLNLNRAFREAEHPGCVFVGIGGILDNEVGFLYAPPGCTVPAMSPDRFIYVERIAGSWFLFKTT